MYIFNLIYLRWSCLKEITLSKLEKGNEAKAEVNEMKNDKYKLLIINSILFCFSPSTYQF